MCLLCSWTRAPTVFQKSSYYPWLSSDTPLAKLYTFLHTTGWWWEVSTDIRRSTLLVSEACTIILAVKESLSPERDKGLDLQKIEMTEIEVYSATYARFCTDFPLTRYSKIFSLLTPLHQTMPSHQLLPPLPFPHSLNWIMKHWVTATSHRRGILNCSCGESVTEMTVGDVVDWVLGKFRLLVKVNRI